MELKCTGGTALMGNHLRLNHNENEGKPQKIKKIKKIPNEGFRSVFPVPPWFRTQSEKIDLGYCYDSDRGRPPIYKFPVTCHDEMVQI
jgi:hypothetical protein